TPVVSDPRRLATSALHGGLGAALAPGWVVVGDRGGLPPAELPEVLVADAAAGGDWGVEYAVTGAGGSWTRRLLDDGEPAVRAAGRVRREPGRLVGPVPAGRTLEELLLAGCLGRDLPQLRRLLGEYATWLTARCDPDGRLPGEFAFATPRHTIVNGTSFAVLDPSWTVAVPVPYEVGLARALRAFAVTLIGDGYSHPWPASSDADSLTVILAGMAGHAIERTVARQAVDLEAELQGAVRGWDDDTRAEFAARLAAVDAGTLPPDVDSHRKLHQSVLRLRQELEHTEAKLAWYEELLTSRENALKRTQRTVDMLSGSLSYRVGRLLMAPVRVAKRVARGAYRRLRSR
ncbi:MAG TPA: class I SAM-dependent methyltransferase, partial [Pilimelia sp.]|nr:class I SAM-dependent methyltransferase [Pilimelia sp.]